MLSVVVARSGAFLKYGAYGLIWVDVLVFLGKSPGVYLLPMYVHGWCFSRWCFFSPSMIMGCQTLRSTFYHSMLCYATMFFLDGASLVVCRMMGVYFSEWWLAHCLLLDRSRSSCFPGMRSLRRVVHPRRVVVRMVLLSYFPQCIVAFLSISSLKPA